MKTLAEASAPKTKKEHRPRLVFEHQALLSAEQTAAMLGRGVTKFFELRRDDPSFPRPVRLDPNAPLQWIRSEIHEWILARPRVDDFAEVGSRRGATGPQGVQSAQGRRE